jgi:cytidyltransferase-like protein
VRIIYAPGCYDLLHRGHRNFLRRSKALGDYLIAAVVTDDGAEAYKRRPVQDQGTRLGNVADLRYVDLAVYQPGTDPTPTLVMLDALGLKPDILTHGDDWDRLKQGHEALLQLGIGFVLVPYTHGVSTTETISRMTAG